MSYFFLLLLGSLVVDRLHRPTGDCLATATSRLRAPLFSPAANVGFALCASAEPIASTLAAANFLFLPPTHTDAGNLLQGYRRKVLCRLYWLWTDLRVLTNVWRLCPSLFCSSYFTIISSWLLQL